MLSIVFEALVPDSNGKWEWSGLFTGDASASNIFRDWDGKPRNYNLIKSKCVPFVRKGLVGSAGADDPPLTSRSRTSRELL